MRHPLPRGAVHLPVLVAVALFTATCASSRSVEETQAVNIEVLNNVGPSFEVRVRITPVGNRRKAVPLGWVPLGETRTFYYEAPLGRYYLSADGRSHGQTGALTARNPKNTSARSERFTIGEHTDRIIWQLDTNHLEVQPPQ